LGEGREREIKKMHFPVFFKRIFCIFLILEHPLPQKKEKRERRKKAKRLCSVIAYRKTNKDKSTHRIKKRHGDLLFQRGYF
jgi:hypothetical protein